MSVKETESVSAPRLHYLDALRGIAAVYVVFHHAYGSSIRDGIGAFPRPLAPVYHSMLYGHYAVDLFIVLSGYCLMLPVVLTGDGVLRGGTLEFVRRRARRLLPPYYAAVVLSIVLTVLALRTNVPGAIVPTALATAWIKPLLAHLLLVQNLHPDLPSDANAALWSVASEWQIYFIFALLLLPLWRRAGIGLVLLVSALVTMLPYVLWPGLTTLREACPWYVVLFAQGMAAAQLGFSPAAAALRARLPWRFVPLAALLLAGAAVKLFLGGKNHALTDPLLGALIALMLAYLAQLRMQAGRLPGVLKALESRPLVGLGVFSYSLYLTHWPVLQLCRALIPITSIAPLLQFFIVLPAQVALSVAVAYAFHTRFERPFLRTKSRRRAALETPALAR